MYINISLTLTIFVHLAQNKIVLSVGDLGNFAQSPLIATTTMVNNFRKREISISLLLLLCIINSIIYLDIRCIFFLLREKRIAADISQMVQYNMK